MVRPLNAAMVSSTKPDSFERVGVDHHLHVVLVGYRQRAVDGRRRRAPVLVQLEAGGAAQDLFDEALGLRGITLAGEGEVHREGVDRLDHAREVPGPGRAGGGGRAGGRAGAAAHHHGDAGVERLLDLLRADEMDVAVDAAGGEDLAFAGDRLRARADDDVDARLDVGVAGLAYCGDAPVAQADIGLEDAGMIDDQRIGDDGVDGALGAGDLALPHAVADHLATAELHLLAVGGEVLLHLDDEIRVGQPHLVAGGRPEHVGIGGAGHLHRHATSPCAKRVLSYCNRVKPGTSDAASSKVIVVPQPAR